jgi:hypothetical protein
MAALALPFPYSGLPLDLVATTGDPRGQAAPWAPDERTLVIGVTGQIACVLWPGMAGDASNRSDGRASH